MTEADDICDEIEDLIYHESFSNLSTGQLLDPDLSELRAVERNEAQVSTIGHERKSSQDTAQSPTSVATGSHDSVG